MDELKRLFDDVENKLRQNISCDRDIFIVLHPRAVKKDLTECGHHLIEIINGVRKAANVEKRIDYPNLVLVQTIHEVPKTSNNIVYWNSQVFGETLAIRLKQINRLLDSSTVYNPFVTRDGCLVNSYGPIRQNLNLDPSGHELNHDSFKNSLHEVINGESKVFSIFQTFVHGIFYSRYCGHCLSLLLEFMKNAKHVYKFVWNLSRGIWSPKAHDEMVQCFDWKQDDEKQYKPNCWRLLEEEVRNDDYFGPVSSSSSEVVSSNISNCDGNKEEGDDARKEQRSEEPSLEPNEIEERNFDSIGTTTILANEVECVESCFTIETQGDDSKKERDERKILKQAKSKPSSTKRRRMLSSKEAAPQAKKMRAVQAVKADRIQEERTKMFIMRIVDAGFRISNRQENVIDLLPKDQSTWTRDQHRMTALGYTFYKLQHFEPEFLKNRSGRMIPFKPVVVEEDEKESDEEETSTDEPSTSGSVSDPQEIISAGDVSPSSTDSSTRAQNDEHDKLNEVIMEDLEKTVEPLAGEPSAFGNEEKDQNDELDQPDEVVMKSAADVPSSDCPVTSGFWKEKSPISQKNGDQNPTDTELVVTVKEKEVITLEDDDVIILSDSDDDIICLD